MRPVIINYIGLILVLMTFLACDTLNHILPKGKYKLDDLHDVPIYGIFYECTGKEEQAITYCVGGIKDGQFYCDKAVNFKCQKGDTKLFTAYDIKSRSKLESYIKYIFDRFKDE